MNITSQAPAVRAACRVPSSGASISAHHHAPAASSNPADSA
jgi:hypothetical protein